MSDEKKSNSLWGVIFLIALISSLTFWAYKEIMVDFQTMESSHNMMQALLENQTHFVRSYAQKIEEYKVNLAKTEELLTEAQSENSQLKEKLAFLDNMSEIENKIALLEKQNAEIKAAMQAASEASRQREEKLTAQLQEFLNEQNFKTIQEGQAILAKMRKRFKSVKARIRDFKIQERSDKIAALKNQDQAELLAGNNGYLIRDGQSTVMAEAHPARPKNVHIDVTFVK